MPQIISYFLGFSLVKWVQEVPVTWFAPSPHRVPMGTVPEGYTSLKDRWSSHEESPTILRLQVQDSSWCQIGGSSQCNYVQLYVYFNRLTHR